MDDVGGAQPSIALSPVAMRSAAERSGPLARGRITEAPQNSDAENLRPGGNAGPLEVSESSSTDKFVSIVCKLRVTRTSARSCY